MNRLLQKAHLRADGRETKTRLRADGLITRLRKDWLWLVVNIGSAVPLLWLAWDFWTGNLSVNPIDDFTDRTGSAAIILLLLSLAVTPINTVTGFRQVVGTRKSLGLWAFGYAFLHFLVFVGLDYGFSIEFIIKDGLVQKPYAIAGFLALLILIPLAITSTKGWMRRLGRNWKRLHKWVYAAGVLAVLHFAWISKGILGEALIYAVVLSVLLLLRVPVVRKWAAGLRPKGKKPARRSPPKKRPSVTAEA